MQTRLGIQVLFLFIVFSQLVSVVSAQDPVSETLIVEGITHTITYPPSTATQQLTVIRRVLNSTLSRYSSLFGIQPPSLHVMFSNNPPRPTTLAAAGPNNNASDTYNCDVFIYPRPENRLGAAFSFTLAHEIAHCFQFAVNPASLPLPGVRDDNGWWVEGSAEWLASRLYPPVGAPLDANIRDFYNISNQTPFIYEYENFWFFNFLGQHLGESVVMRLVRDMPRTRDEQIRYIEGLQPSPALMLAYGRMAQRRSLRYQPAYPPTIEGYPAAVLPHTQLARASALSIQPVKITVPIPAGGRGINIALTDGQSKGYRAMLPDGTEITAEGVMLCEVTQPDIYLMVVRGWDTDENAAATLTFREGTCVGENCFAGEWVSMDRQHVGSDPMTFMIEPQVEGEVTLIISDGGTVTGQVVGTQHFSNGFVLTDVPNPVSGNFSVTGSATEFLSGSSLLVPIRFDTPITGAVTGSGGTFVLDASDGSETWTFYDTGMSANAVFPAYQTIECTNRTTSPDGQVMYGLISFYEGSVEQVIEGSVFPIFYLYRPGTP